MRTIAAAALAAAAVALSACGGSGQKPPCMVLGNGNQVCGAQAAAWCRLTDPGRNAAISNGLAGNEQLLSTQADCLDVEAKY